MANNNLPQNKNNSHNKTFLQKLCKTFFISLIGFATLFLIILALLPTIVSTSWGQKQIESYLSNKIKKTVTFKELHFSFLGTQEIKGLKIEDKQENLLLELSSAGIDQSFPDLIFQGLKESNIQFSDLNLKLKNVALKNVNGEFSLYPVILRLKGLSVQNQLEGEFDLDIALNGLDFDEVLEVFFDPELFLSSSANLKASLKAENFPVLLIDSFFASITEIPNSDFFSALLGDRLNLSLNKLKASEDNHLTLELTATSPNLDTHIITEFSSNEIFAAKPSTLNLKIDQNFLDRFFQKSSFKLDAGASIALHLDAFNLPFNLKTREHDFSKLMLKGNLDLSHFPVALLDHFFGLDNQLSKGISPYANAKVEAAPDKNGMALVLQLESEKLSLLPTRLILNKDLKLLEPLQLEYRLNKETAEKLLPENAFLSINSDKPIHAALDFEPIQNIYELKDNPREEFKGSLLIKQVAFNVKNSHKELFFENILLPWQLDAKEQKIELNFSGITRPSHKPKESQFSGKAHWQKEDKTYLFDIAFEIQKHSGEKSHLKLTGNSENLFTDEGGLNIYGLSLNLDAKIDNLPTPFFCKTACLHPDLHQKIEVLFGKILNGDLHASIKELDGTIQANVEGQDGSLTLDSFVQDGMLFLNKPFEAKFKVTPRLGKSLLQDVLPFLSGVTESDQPIAFTVSDEGFSFPIKKLDVSKIEIPHAFLSLGHVKFDNSGELAAVLNLLTPENSDLISVWFTPLYFNMHEGTFRLQRVDMLISNEFPIAAWGKIDLLKDKVKMMIGMSGRALTHAFKIKGLEDDYMLQIPLIGKTSKATVDKPTATAKIGALVAQSHGGSKGLVLGTVLSLAGGALSEKRTPPPTTEPLPWASQLTSQVKDAEEESKNKVVLEESGQNTSLKKKSNKKKLNKFLEQHAEKLLNQVL